MKEINFIAGGMMGDFIQSLYAVKNICEQQNAKANIYLADGYGGDKWKFNLEKTFDDIYMLVLGQSYVNSLKILPDGFNEPYINLNDWRSRVEKSYAEKGVYSECWSDIMSNHYGFEIPKQYRWIDVSEVNQETKGKILIHRSKHRHNNSFPWNVILDGMEDLLFITTDESEWDEFSFKNENINPYIVSTISDMANAIGSCHIFIGNQSAPFSLACALDIERVVELDIDQAGFYMEERKYSENMSFYLNEDIKHLSVFN